MYKNSLKVLGCTEKSTWEQIKKAKKDEWYKHHPDRPDNRKRIEEAKEKF